MGETLLGGEVLLELRLHEGYKGGAEARSGV